MISEKVAPVPFFPMTGEAPDDPRTGFLPPNNGTTGQGYVTFTVRLKKNLPPLTRIDAKASIYFDKNEPIDTPPIFNTVSGFGGREVRDVKNRDICSVNLNLEIMKCRSQ